MRLVKCTYPMTHLVVMISSVVVDEALELVGFTVFFENSSLDLCYACVELIHCLVPVAPVITLYLYIY